jgi:hypothetical protein
MLMMRVRRLPIRTMEGWAQVRARSVLLEAGAIHECEEHGWMRDRADPHARERAFAVARQDPPSGVSPQAAAVAIAEVLDSIGDTPGMPTRCRVAPKPRYALPTRYGVASAARIVRAVSRPPASAASTVPTSRPRLRRSACNRGDPGGPAIPATWRTIPARCAARCPIPINDEWSSSSKRFDRWPILPTYV